MYVVESIILIIFIYSGGRSEEYSYSIIATYNNLQMNMKLSTISRIFSENFNKCKSRVHSSHVFANNFNLFPTNIPTHTPSITKILTIECYMRISYDESGFECNLQQSKPHISASRRKTITNHWHTYTSNWRNEDGMKQTFLNIPHYAFYDDFGNGLENITTKSSNCLGVECIHAKMVGSFQNISLPRASSNSITNSLLATPWIRAICTLKLHLQFRFHATIKSNFCHAYQKFRRPCSCHFQFRHLTGEWNQKWERDRVSLLHLHGKQMNTKMFSCQILDS